MTQKREQKNRPPTLDLSWKVAGDKVVARVTASKPLIGRKVVFSALDAAFTEKIVTIDARGTAECVISIPSGIKGINVEVWLEEDPHLRTSKYVSLAESKNYTDKVRLEALGKDGQYHLVIFLTDQNSNPIEGQIFRLVNKSDGKFIKPICMNSLEYYFDETPYDFISDRNGTIDPRPFIKVEKGGATIRLEPMNFRLPDQQLPEITIAGPSRFKRMGPWYMDNNFWGYTLWCITLALLIATIGLGLHNSFMWSLNLTLMIACFTSPFWMFWDEVVESVEKAYNKFTEERHFYVDLPDRPIGGGGVSGEVKNVAKQSLIESIGSFIKYIGDELLIGIGLHKLFGRRRK